MAIMESYHVKVWQCSTDRPENWSSFHTLKPQIIGELQGKDGYAFIVITACYGAAAVAWNDCYEACCE